MFYTFSNDIKDKKLPYILTIKYNKDKPTKITLKNR